MVRIPAGLKVAFYEKYVCAFYIFSEIEREKKKKNLSMVGIEPSEKSFIIQ
jgi:hypothetical protein